MCQDSVTASLGRILIKGNTRMITRLKFFRRYLTATNNFVLCVPIGRDLTGCDQLASKCLHKN